MVAGTLLYDLSYLIAYQDALNNGNLTGANILNEEELKALKIAYVTLENMATEGRIEKSTDSNTWIKRDLIHEIEVITEVLNNPGLPPNAVSKEVARWEGKLSMAFTCDVITLEEKKELQEKLQGIAR